MAKYIVCFVVTLILQGTCGQYNSFAALGSFNSGLGQNFGLGQGAKLGQNFGLGQGAILDQNFGLSQGAILGPNFSVGQNLGIGGVGGLGISSEPWQIVSASAINPTGVTAVAENAFQASCGCGERGVNVVDGLNLPRGGRGGLQFYP